MLTARDRVTQIKLTSGEDISILQSCISERVYKEIDLIPEPDYIGNEWAVYNPNHHYRKNNHSLVQKQDDTIPYYKRYLKPYN